MKILPTDDSRLRTFESVAMNNDLLGSSSIVWKVFAIITVV